MTGQRSEGNHHNSKELALCYKDLLDQTSDLVQCVNSDGRFIYVNQTWLSTLKYSAEEAAEITLQQVIHPDSLEPFRIACNQVCEGKTTGRLKARFINKEGSPVLVEGNISVKVDKEGDILHVTGIFRNLTAREQAEAKLTENERKLRLDKENLDLILENVSDIVWRYDLDARGNFVSSYISPAGAKQLGITETALNHSFDTWFSHVVPEDLPSVQKAMTDALKSGRGKLVEYRIKQPDGTLKWIQSAGNPITREDGGISLIGSGQDITERKTVEQDLARSEERFQKMLSLVPDFISIHDAEMNIVYSNWNGFGAVPAEKRVIDTKCYKTYRGLDQVCPDCQAVKVLQTGEGLEKEVELPEGVWVDLRVIPILGENNTVDFFLEWVRDISHLKKSEKEALAQQKMLEGIMDNVADILSIQKPDHSIVSYNQAGYDLLSMTPEEVRGKKCYHLIGRDSECEGCATSKALKSGKLEEVERYFPELGIHLNCRTTPIFEDGKVTVVIQHLRDITERKKAEESLRNSEESSRKKIQAILEPQGDIGELSLGDIIDHQALQSMMEEFYRITKIPNAVVDLSGKTLVHAGWQDICVHFHRANPESLKHCLEAARELGSGLAAGTYKVSRCQNNMWDIATPIEISGKHMGTIIVGQFLYEDESVDYELYRRQARQYGFNETEYLAALDRAPRLKRELVEAAMGFYSRLAGMISSLSFSTIKLSRTLTEQKRTEQALRESEQKYREILSTMEEGYYEADLAGNLVFFNDSFCRLTGYSKEELLGNNYTQFFESPEVALEAFNEVYRTEKPVTAVDWPATTKDGRNNHWELSIALRRDKSGQPVGFRGVVRDITARRQADEKVRYLSYHDQLTGLYNRYFLEEEMERLDTERQLPISIIMADLNGLKLVNDTLGHLSGDEMLKKTAAILRSICREEDLLARFGGDEFLLYLPSTPEEVARKISERIEKAYRREQIQDIPLSISTGLAVKVSVEEKLTDLLRAAEDNMYRDKLTESRSGKSAIVNSLLKTLAAMSFETETHTNNMQETAKVIGEKIGLPHSELHRLQLLITLHDIGKINIPEELLNKKGALSPAEWVIMQQHCETGYRIAKATENFGHVAEDILAHHERWDGSGYPQGLKEEEIPLLSRITAVADAYEVMSNGRPYKKAMSKNEIKAELINCSGTHFDPHLVKLFLEVLEGNGDKVL